MLGAIWWTVLTALGAPPASTEILRVTLVDERDGSPAAGAELFVRTRASAGRTQRSRHADLLAFEREVLAAGTLARADAHGVVELALPAGDARLELLARAPGLFAVDVLEVEFGSPPRERELVLLPDHELRVRVVDADRRSASGVPVCVRRRWGSVEVALLETASGDDGVAMIEHAGYLLAREQRLGIARELHVALDLCLDRDVSAAFDGPRDDAIELELPPAAPVEVVFVGPDGTPIQPGSPIHLAVNAGLAWRFAAFEPEAERPSGAVHALARDGRARFAHVGLGLELIASGRWNVASAPRYVAFRGPTKEGERVVVELTLDGELACVAGRLLGADGRPLVRARVAVGPFAPWEDPSGASLELQWPEFETDADGRFALDVDLHARQPSDAPLALRRRGEDGAWLTARLPSEDLRARASSQVGDVLLELPPIVAGGRVIDQDGAPVVGAHVERFEPFPLFDDSEHRELRDDMWRTKTDEHGRFELRAISSDAPFTLLARAAHLDPVRASVDDVVPGTRDLTLLLPAPSRVEGRAALPPGANPLAFEVHVHPRATTWHDRFLGSSEPPNTTTWFEGGWFRTSPVAPGPAVLRVMRAERVLLEREVEVPPGAATRIALDLRTFVPRIELALRDAAGERVVFAAYTVRPPGAGTLDDLWREPLLQHVDSGTIELDWVRSPCDLLVAARGFRFARFEVGVETRELTLETAPSLALELEPAPRALSDAERLTLVLLGPDTPYRGATPLRVESTPFDAAGRAALSLPADSVYCLRLELDSRVQGEGLERTTWELGKRELTEAVAREPFRIATPHELLD